MSPEPAWDVVVPDLVHPVIGFRQWRLTEGRLCSPFEDVEWQGGRLQADCHVAADAASDHSQVPSGHCSCGVYAYYDPLPRTASMWPELVAGAVTMWGEIQAHATGLRAQFGQAAVLALPIERGRKRRRLLALARELGIEVVRPRHLRAAALSHGLTLPEQLRPRLGSAG